MHMKKVLCIARGKNKNKTKQISTKQDRKRKKKLLYYCMSIPTHYYIKT